MTGHRNDVSEPGRREARGRDTGVAARRKAPTGGSKQRVRCGCTALAGRQALCNALQRCRRLPVVYRLLHKMIYSFWPEVESGFCSSYSAS